MVTTLLCLHGWGGSKESFTELREALKDSAITILTPDLPGFGNEPEPRKPWTTDDYAEWVTSYIHKNISGPYMLLGHSHGGRIAIKIANRKSQIANPNHLFLCASAGIRHPRHFKRILGLTLAKAGKTLLQIPGLKSLEPMGKKFLYRLVRVHDYEKASPVMRQTLINVTKEDLRPLLSHIAVPTDIFWGEDDKMTPVSDAHVMHKAIVGSTLHLYKGVRHRVHRERAREIAEVVTRRKSN
jgi:pimeloyl-ACP methyl ester carboxylesterase